MLELLFVDDPTALASSHAPLNLQQRFTSSEASPFGIGFRPSAARGESASFPSADYRPEFLPDGAHIEVMDGGLATDPLIFHLPFLAPFSETTSSINALSAAWGSDHDKYLKNMISRR